VSKFSDSVVKVVKSIKKGKTMSYKEVAIAAGYPDSYRSVASLMKKNFDESIPCHRVIKSNGFPGDYNRGGEYEKFLILTKEGAIIKNPGNPNINCSEQHYAENGVIG